MMDGLIARLKSNTAQLRRSARRHSSAQNSAVGEVKETEMATATATTKQPKELPAPNQRLLRAYRRLDRRGSGDCHKGARLHADEGQADHRQVLVRRRFPF